MVQIVLGLARLASPLVGWRLPRLVWSIHPVLGVAIAVGVAVLLRPSVAAATARRRLARFAPLAPLGLGLALAAGVPLGAALVPVHALVGLVVLGLVDGAVKQELARADPPGRGVPASAVGS